MVVADPDVSRRADARVGIGGAGVAVVGVGVAVDVEAIDDAMPERGLDPVPEPELTARRLVGRGIRLGPASA